MELEILKGVGKYYTKPNLALRCESIHNSCRQYKVKLSELRIGITYGYMMSKNDQQLLGTNTTCRNQKLTIKYCLQEYLNERTTENI